MSAEDLARRAVACKGWRWMPGMLIAVAFKAARLPWSPGGPVVRVRPCRVVRVDDQGNPWAAWGAVDDSRRSLGPGDMSTQGGHFAPRGHATLPDLDDPATLGCLVALVRGVYGDPSMCTSTNKSAHGVVWWALYSRGYGPFGVGGGLPATEAEALVCALEASP